MNPPSNNGHLDGTPITPTAPPDLSLQRRLYAAESVARDALARYEAVQETLDTFTTLLAGQPQPKAFVPNPRPTGDETKKATPPPHRTAATIAATGIPEVHYLIDGLLPREALVLLTGIAKGGGKTTFLVHLIRALIAGTPFLGFPATRTPVVYLTEQPLRNFFDGYLNPTDLSQASDLHLLFGYEAAGLAWTDLIHHAVRHARCVEARLLVIDTFLHFARFTGDQENASAAVQAALRPLQHAVAEHGLSIVLVHHDRKSGGDVYSAGRGSSAFQGAVDLIFNLTLPPGNHRPTIREMRTTGRYSDVPDQLMIELTDGGYQALGTERAVAAQTARDLALTITPTSEADARTAPDLEAAAREHDPHVARTTFRRALAELTAQGHLHTLGTGKRGAPYRYYRPLDEQLSP